jgi:hypothetical protein
MHGSETDDLTTFCSGCGAELSLSGERLFPIGADEVICYACAVQRGGSYDESQDRWAPPPDIGDLADKNARLSD